MQKLALLLSLVLMSGCSVSEFSESIVSNVPIVNYFAGCNYCTVKIKSTKRTNQGAPFYLVVKDTTFPAFLSEDYPQIAGMLDNPPDDDPCFGVFCIIPGKDQMLTVERPPGVCSLGFYFLFTTPGNIWKQFVEIIDGAPVIRIVLDGNEVVSIG